MDEIGRRTPETAIARGGVLVFCWVAVPLWFRETKRKTECILGAPVKAKDMPVHFEGTLMANVP